MSLTRCSLCGHDNPEHSRFCNGCGAALLQADPPASVKASPEAPAAVAPEPKPDLAAHAATARPPRHHGRLNPVQRWLIACSPVATVLAGLAYFTYSQLSVTDVAGLLPALPTTETSAGIQPGAVVPVGAVMPPAPEPVAAPRAAVIDEPRAPREHAATARKTTPAGTRSDPPVDPAPIDVAPCTAAVAALGLCTPPTLAAIRE